MYLTINYDSGEINKKTNATTSIYQAFTHEVQFSQTCVHYKCIIKFGLQLFSSLTLLRSVRLHSVAHLYKICVSVWFLTRIPSSNWLLQVM